MSQSKGQKKVAKSKKTITLFPPQSHRTVIKEVPSGEIALEIGADGTYLRFDCDCNDALPYCKSMCCSLPGIAVDKDEVKAVEKAWSNTGSKLPIVQLNDENEPEMIRSSDSWCRALDRCSRSCKIYNDRPGTCKDFHCTRGESNRGWLLSINRQAEFDV